MFNLFLKSVFLTMVLFLTLVLLAIAKNGVQGTDFISFYTGALIVRNGEGRFLYDEKTQGKYQKPFSQNLSVKLLPYRNPPFVALFFIPFTLFSFGNAYLLLGFLNMGAVLFIGYLSRKLFINIRQPIFFSLIPLLYWPVIQNFILGQISLFLSLVFFLVYLFYKKGRYFSAGLIIGLLLFKPQYLLITPFLFLLSKGKSFLMGLIVSALVILAVSFLVSGFTGLAKYPHFIAATENPIYGSRIWHYYTLDSALKMVGFGDKSAVLNFFLYLTFFVLFVFRKKFLSFDRIFVFITLCAILFSVHSLTHDSAILLLPIFILMNQKKWLPVLVLLLLPFAKEFNLAWFVGIGLFIFNTWLLFLNPSPKRDFEW